MLSPRSLCKQGKHIHKLYIIDTVSFNACFELQVSHRKSRVNLCKINKCYAFGDTIAPLNPSRFNVFLSYLQCRSSSLQSDCLPDVSKAKHHLRSHTAQEGTRSWCQHVCHVLQMKADHCSSHILGITLGDHTCGIIHYCFTFYLACLETNKTLNVLVVLAVHHSSSGI